MPAGLFEIKHSRYEEYWMLLHAAIIGGNKKNIQRVERSCIQIIEEKREQDVIISLLHVTIRQGRHDLFEKYHRQFGKTLTQKERQALLAEAICFDLQETIMFLATCLRWRTIDLLRFAVLSGEYGIEYFEKTLSEDPTLLELHGELFAYAQSLKQTTHLNVMLKLIEKHQLHIPQKDYRKFLSELSKSYTQMPDILGNKQNYLEVFQKILKDIPQIKVACYGSSIVNFNDELNTLLVQLPDQSDILRQEDPGRSMLH